ncbi:MAG: TatD family hydrolase [Chloroflexota bacterium]|nr:TatD family hydrolase [Chloroflexota bacterium]
MRFFDSHTHLESPRFDKDRGDVIARAYDAGVITMVTCGSDLDTSEEALALAQAHEGVWAAIGVHPHEAQSMMLQKGEAFSVSEVAFAKLAELAKESEVVAIGEIGLDYYYDFSPREAQRAVLARSLELAHELNVPVILHNRESDVDMQRVFDSGPRGMRGVLHCFLADAEMATWAMERDLYVGVAGPITFENISHLPDIVRRIPLNRLLLETDCPYLAPVPKRGHRNEPAYLPYVAERLAQVLDMPLEELALHTRENACRLFEVP